MTVHQKIVCEKCNCPDFDYDSQWKEYSCAHCGWIVEDKEKISNIEKEIEAKPNSPQNDTENDRRPKPYSPKPVAQKRKVIQGIVLMTAGGLWVVFALTLPMSGVLIRLQNGKSAEAFGSFIVVLFFIWLGVKVAKRGYNYFKGHR